MPPFYIPLSKSGFKNHTHRAATRYEASVPHQIPATGNKAPATKLYITILVDASNITLPVACAKAKPADRLNIIMADNIMAGKEAKRPAQKADPVLAIRTEAPTTLPANNALNRICPAEYLRLILPMEGIFNTFSAKR